MPPDQETTTTLPLEPVDTPTSPTNESPDSGVNIDSAPLETPPEAPETPMASADAVPANIDITPSPSAQPQPTNIISELLQKARSAIQNRKAKKLEKILVALDKRGKISNDEVQKLLSVSDATATRYLNILEQQGKIRQAGKTGKYTFYTKF